MTERRPFGGIGPFIYIGGTKPNLSFEQRAVLPCVRLQCTKVSGWNAMVGGTTGAG